MSQRPRDIRKYIQKGYSVYESFESFELGAIAQGLTSIKTNNRWFDFIYEDRGANVTLVSFSAAASARTETYPNFSGRGVALALDVNWLAFSDAASGSAESLPTFWHLGTRRVESRKFIPAVVRKVLKQDDAECLLFFGSSAGGFAALNYGSQFQGSASFVMNPRVNLLSQPNRFDKYSGVAFSGIDPERLVRSLPFDMAKHYSTPRSNSVFYLQNMQDVTYTTHHYRPFAAAVRGKPSIQFITGDWGVGHVVPPREVYMGPLASLVSSAPDWKVS